MTTITELRELPTGRFAVGFSDGSEVKLSADAVADLGLYPGKELSDEALLELASRVSLTKCKERALRIIGARPMSEKELCNRLIEKGETPENAEETVAWMVGLHYLDDEQYAGMVVRHYAAKGYGAQKIKSELYRRGVPRELWETALEERPDDAETVYTLLCRKLRSDTPDRQEMKRATDALFRRGYSWDEISCAVNRFWDEHSPD
jgi:regulatory protein